MKVIVVNKKNYPHDFGSAFIRKLRIEHGIDFYNQEEIESLTTKPVAEQSEMIYCILRVALNEGSRKAGQDVTYTIDDVCDLIDEDSTYLEKALKLLNENKEKKNKNSKQLEESE